MTLPGRLIGGKIMILDESMRSWKVPKPAWPSMLPISHQLFTHRYDQDRLSKQDPEDPSLNAQKSQGGHAPNPTLCEATDSMEREVGRRLTC